MRWRHSERSEQQKKKTYSKKTTARFSETILLRRVTTEPDDFESSNIDDFYTRRCQYLRRNESTEPTRFVVHKLVMRKRVRKTYQNAIIFHCYSN